MKRAKIKVIRQVKSRGFTFAEVLAAMVFVGIVIPVAVHGILVANRVGEVAYHKRVAVKLAEGLLNELIITGDWADSEDEGDFGEDWTGYTW